MSDTLLLAWFASDGASPAVPVGEPVHPSTSWTGPELYGEIGGMLERAGVHLIVVGDSIADDSGRLEGPATDVPWRLDPVPVCVTIASVTSSIGVVPGISWQLYPPFMLSRLVDCVDHISAGRAGWMPEFALGARSAEVFGAALDPAVDPVAAREEYLSVCEALWQSWEPDAIVGDWSTAVFADPSKVHEVGFEGEYYQVRGPLNSIHPI